MNYLQIKDIDEIIKLADEHNPPTKKTTIIESNELAAAVIKELESPSLKALDKKISTLSEEQLAELIALTDLGRHSDMEESINWQLLYDPALRQVQSSYREAVIYLLQKKRLADFLRKGLDKLS
ncbi:DUF3775 domain-containing protein [Celerinatantimonas sp. MCCC 1A17872]|uniref:DUF3775 domain-containing protein n=1 Tax=Celerinatantimonas sp. MCCC 1A17872 TaxID=3177514 RepID=UPI0038C39CC3